MRCLVIYGLVLLALAFICEAASPVQLSGSNGQAILNQVASSVQTINASTNNQVAGLVQIINTSTNTPTNPGLWNWGSIPIGYTVDNPGILTDQNILSNTYGGWTPSI